MNQNQREGLLVWLHSRADRWGKEFTQGLKVRINIAMDNFFTKKELWGPAKSISRIDVKIKKLHKSIDVLTKERNGIYGEILDVCEIKKPTYGSRHTGSVGEDILGYVREQCMVEVNVRDPQRYNGSLIERYADGRIKISVSSSSGMIKDHIRTLLKKEIDLVHRLNDFKADTVTKIMLLESVDDARKVVKSIKDTFK